MNASRKFIAALLLASTAAGAQVAPAPLVGLLPAQLQGPVSGSFQASGSGSSTNTFNGVAFGPTCTNRYIIVVGYVVSNQTFNSITIAGITATIATSANSGISQLKVGYAQVASGTSGTISLNYTTPGTTIYGLYSVCGSSGNTAPVTSAAQNPTLTVPFGSFVIGGNGDTNNDTRTWTGVAQDANPVLTGSLGIASKQYTAAGSTTFNVTAGGPVTSWAGFPP